MARYFNIDYEFDRDEVHRRIARRIGDRKPGYVCVADGVILDIANRDAGYRRVVDGGMFALCDSSFVPLYIRWIYGLRYNQYCGSQIFRDIDDLSAKLTYLWDNPSECLLLGEKAHKKLINRYSTEVIARRWQQVLNKTAERTT